MANGNIAGKWMAENGHKWGKGKRPPIGAKAKFSSCKDRRKKRGKNLGQKVKCSIAEFVEVNQLCSKSGCIFIPGAQRDVPASVVFCGNNISAARYMLLLTQGAPKSTGMVARHLCGNGHLSCVNPNHLAWGSQSDNISDASKHRIAGDHYQDRINAI